MKDYVKLIILMLAAELILTGLFIRYNGEQLEQLNSRLDHIEEVLTRD